MENNNNNNNNKGISINEGYKPNYKDFGYKPTKGSRTTTAKSVKVKPRGGESSLD
ncbi:hypothetical protein [Clostridium perfringens]|uniref:hypothetical protein n=1 Tax=Clostridium perfringens TaxID=1502 RepID=UPI0024BD033F|nr:hypothetical protein [Clostridium perfringens]